MLETASVLWVGNSAQGRVSSFRRAQMQTSPEKAKPASIAGGE